VGDGIEIDVGSALPYLEERFLTLFDKDQASRELAEWFKGLQTSAIAQTQFVQCLGMRNPLPFDNIYQATRLIVGPDPDDSSNGESFVHADRVSRSILRGRTFEERSITVADFLQNDQDALIFSGPGWGKTTFVHHVLTLNQTANSQTIAIS
jgi:hypothetical protein